jgi:hypothetical protein
MVSGCKPKLFVMFAAHRTVIRYRSSETSLVYARGFARVQQKSVLRRFKNQKIERVISRIADRAPGAAGPVRRYWRLFVQRTNLVDRGVGVVYQHYAALRYDRILLAVMGLCRPKFVL